MLYYGLPKPAKSGWINKKSFVLGAFVTLTGILVWHFGGWRQPARAKTVPTVSPQDSAECADAPEAVDWIPQDGGLPRKFFKHDRKKCGTRVQYGGGTLWDKWKIQEPVCGSAECSGNGWKVRGTEPYCECFNGWKGVTCSEETNRKRRVRGCVVYYTVADSERAKEQTQKMLEDSLLRLERFFLSNYRNHRVILFHNFTKDAVAKIRGLTDATFIDVVPPYEEQILKPTMLKRLPNTCVWHNNNIPYITMCRWFDYFFYKQQVLKDNCDYVWRIDTDIYINSTAECDIFQLLADTETIFGTAEWSVDEWRECIGNVWEFSYNYSRDICTPPVHLHEAGGSAGDKWLKSRANSPGVYFGYINYFKWSFFSSPSFLDYVERFDQDELVAKFRLGEQGMYPHALGVLAPKESIRQIRGFDFSHKYEQKFDYWPEPLCRFQPNYEDFGKPPITAQEKHNRGY